MGICPARLHLHMRVAIVGASGLVGSHCLRLWQQQAGWVVVGTFRSFPTDGTYYYDPLTPDYPENFDLKAFEPEWIVHCGALTHVDRAQQYPAESEQQTVGSTRALIALAKSVGARVAYVSSDYVFNGEVGPYEETDLTRPLSVYGQHKLQAEQLVLREVPQSLVVRITNVYGEETRGKNFVERLIGMFQNDALVQLRLPIDQYATPVHAGDVARALQWLIQDEQKGIWHLAGTEYLSRVHIANAVAAYFPHIKLWMEGLPTNQLSQPAPRPLRGGLLNLKFQREYPHMRWQTLGQYLQERLPNRSS
jgi:dTDP-4-dehydrorhamnose reductase